MSDIKTKKASPEYTRVFTVTESYAGAKKLSDVFAELLYSAYCRQAAVSVRESENMRESA